MGIGEDLLIFQTILEGVLHRREWNSALEILQRPFLPRIPTNLQLIEGRMPQPLTVGVLPTISLYSPCFSDGALRRCEDVNGRCMLVDVLDMSR